MGREGPVTPHKKVTLLISPPPRQGMFIASQVRTLSHHSAQSALRLKRALTDLCFQYEAEEESSSRRRRRRTPSD